MLKLLKNSNSMKGVNYFGWADRRPSGSGSLRVRSVRGTILGMIATGAFFILYNNTFCEAGGNSYSVKVDPEDKKKVSEEISEYKLKKLFEAYKRLLSITGRLLDFDKHLQLNPGSNQKPMNGIPIFFAEKIAKNTQETSGVTIAEMLDDVDSETANIKVGDTVIAIDDIKVHSNKDIKKILDGPLDKRIKLTLSRNDLVFTEEINVIKIWGKFNFHVGGNSTNVSAYTDGRENIYVSPAMMRYIKDDDELAFILAHEIAHIELGHYAHAAFTNTVAAIPAALVGAFVEREVQHSGGITSSVAYEALKSPFSKEREIAADERALYYLRVGGFNVDAGKRLLQRFAVEIPSTMESSFISTHPASPERLRRLSK